MGEVEQEEALARLRSQLGVPAAQRGSDGYLLRFLRTTAPAPLAVGDAQARLAGRREFEKRLLTGGGTTVQVTAHIVDALRGGTFYLLGEDVFNRPVLYLCAGAYTASPDGFAERQLAVMLLEFLESYVALRFGSGHTQQCVLLVNEGNVGFWAAKDSDTHETLANTAQRYYPDLIGGVFVVNSSWGTKRVIRTQVASGSSTLRQLVQFVSGSELGSLIAKEVIPREFGGKNDVAVTSPPAQFSEDVLRHWFAASTAMAAPAAQRERPLWAPLDRARLLDGTFVAARYAGAAAAAGKGGAAAGDRYCDPSPTATAKFTALPPLPGGLKDGFDKNSSLCSACSEASEAFSDPGDVDGGDADGDGGASTAKLRAKLRAEEARRRQLEAELRRTSLGVPPDERTLNTLERTLQRHHTEVNTLVASVIQGAKDKGQHNSLAQLLAATDAALREAIQERDPVDCMKNAMPIPERTPKQGGCIVS